MPRKIIKEPGYYIASGCGELIVRIHRAGFLRTGFPWLLELANGHVEPCDDDGKGPNWTVLRKAPKATIKRLAKHLTDPSA